MVYLNIVFGSHLVGGVPSAGLFGPADGHLLIQPWSEAVTYPSKLGQAPGSDSGSVRSSSPSHRSGAG